MLIDCAECSKSISDSAVSCPLCGAPSPVIIALHRRLDNQATVCRLIVWVSFFAFFFDLKDAVIWVIAWWVGMFGCMYTKNERRNRGV